MQDQPGLMRSNRGMRAGGTGFTAHRNHATVIPNAVKHSMVIMSAMELMSFLKGKERQSPYKGAVRNLLFLLCGFRRVTSQQR